ncbi:hypothetical protein [uncultured Duncaniella sp.]|uniref:hypothetical protein n=1 Tax=uncultured Duncaniella sp. TaxID=2768039 RepID=UPI0023BE4F71|nr:hypothetical protein [uncultured Duncaniella sp.]MDE7356165.1 hypothetical protein [Rikenellaceae bacterium]
MNNKEIALAIVSRITGVATSTILSRTRKWPAVEARQLIILLLSRDGATDETISWMLNRGRGAILKSRHNAMDALRLSKLFRSKFDKISELYEHQKSLRVS